jgi:hypothetical protein
MVREIRFHNSAFHPMARGAFGADRIGGVKTDDAQRRRPHAMTLRRLGKTLGRFAAPRSADAK